ncbi:DNA-binding NarL/FixJ family response regulator [Shimia isoporae]|uniref:DNA-binding NarL/FixJ family response regulator n=1 Tax=Shimia isoporae TaxID=647720 RepID=A0A4R1NJL0_9RHOB|nr:DNA-binding NarL/FixJ family response regulator [Shimia isoporae]
MIVDIGRTLNLPYIDFVTANNYADWQKMLFVRTSYDSSWLNAFNTDPEIIKWSYFRTHAMERLTPIAIGLEFIDEYMHIPEQRYKVLEEAARRGLRAGFSVPLRSHAPPQSSMITFSGDHSKREMKRIIQTHGWVLNTVAVMGFQRYMTHFSAEFIDRNRISEKQRELLEMIGGGLQDKVIAEQLGVTVSAVRQRMNNLLSKTGLNNRADLAALAMSVGLVPDPLSRGADPDPVILVEMGVAPQGKGRFRKVSPKVEKSDD